jgi:hypothetical protein
MWNNANDSVLHGHSNKKLSSLDLLITFKSLISARKLSLSAMRKVMNPQLPIPSLAQSVERKTVTQQSSLGRWFDSGSSDSF